MSRAESVCRETFCVIQNDPEYPNGQDGSIGGGAAPAGVDGVVKALISPPPVHNRGTLARVVVSISPIPWEWTFDNCWEMGYRPVDYFCGAPKQLLFYAASLQLARSSRINLSAVREPRQSMFIRFATSSHTASDSNAPSHYS